MNKCLILLLLTQMNIYLANGYDLNQINELMCLRQKRDNKLLFSCSEQKISSCTKKELNNLSYKELNILKETDKLTGSCKKLFLTALLRKLYIINGVPFQKNESN